MSERHVDFYRLSFFGSAAGQKRNRSFRVQDLHISLWSTASLAVNQMSELSQHFLLSVSDFNSGTSFGFLVEAYTRQVVCFFCKTSKHQVQKLIMVRLKGVFVKLMCYCARVKCKTLVRAYAFLIISPKECCFVLSFACTLSSRQPLINTSIEDRHTSLTSYKKSIYQRIEAPQKYHGAWRRGERPSV